MILDVSIDIYMVCCKKPVNVPAACGAWNCQCRSYQVLKIICVELKQKSAALSGRKQSFCTVPDGHQQILAKS
jgi:hypothetical protein